MKAFLVLPLGIFLSAIGLAEGLSRSSPDNYYERSLMVDGLSRSVPVNKDGRRLGEDGISQPEIVLVSGIKPEVLLEDNEAPAGADVVCCYALVFDTNEVVLVDTEQEVIAFHGTLEEFYGDWYYESHAVIEITSSSGVYAEAEPLNFDRSIYADINTGIGCNHDTRPFFESLPSACIAPIELHDYSIDYGEQVVGTDTIMYEADHRAMSSVCKFDRFSIGPYDINILFQPTVLETTCHRNDDGYGQVVATGLRLNTLGSFTRTGVGADISFSLLASRGLEDVDFINDEWFIPPLVSKSAMVQSSIIEPDTVEDENYQLDRRPAGAEAYDGSHEEEVAGRYLYHGVLYGGHISDQITLCLFTDRFDGQTEYKNVFGAPLRRQVLVNGELNYVQAEEGAFGRRCSIAQDSYRDQHAGYLLPSIGSVMSAGRTGVGPGMRLVLPRNIDISNEVNFWVLEDYSIPGLNQTAKKVSYVLTGLAEKSLE